MLKLTLFLLLGLLSIPATAADPCAGKVAMSIVSYDRDARQGLGLLLNQCGRPVQAEVRVTAHNRHGFPVSWMRTTVQATDADPLSVIRVELPFVQSVMVISGYAAEVAATAVLDLAPGHTAGAPQWPPLAAR